MVHTLHVVHQMPNKFCDYYKLLVIKHSYLTVATPPTIISAEQLNDSNSIRVSWTAGSGGAPVTEYWIYYQAEGDNGSMSAQCNTTEALITGLHFGLNYNITMVALSEHLPSQLSNSTVVEVGEKEVPHWFGCMLCFNKYYTRIHLIQIISNSACNCHQFGFTYTPSYFSIPPCHSAL